MCTVRVGLVTYIDTITQHICGVFSWLLLLFFKRSELFKMLLNVIADTNSVDLNVPYRTYF